MIKFMDSVAHGAQDGRTKSSSCHLLKITFLLPILCGTLSEHYNCHWHPCLMFFDRVTAQLLLGTGVMNHCCAFRSPRVRQP
jgi:hypothetical protein